MQQPVYLDIAKDANGLWPVCWGQADGHMSDWRGCNYRYLNLPGWPRGRRLADTPYNRRVLRALFTAIVPKHLARKVANRPGTTLSDALCDTFLNDYRPYGHPAPAGPDPL